MHWKGITYRDEYNIAPGLNPVFAPFEWSHEEYDGAPDANDNRCGFGQTVEECQAEIDQLILDEKFEHLDERQRYPGETCPLCESRKLKYMEGTPDTFSGPGEQAHLSCRCGYWTTWLHEMKPEGY